MNRDKTPYVSVVIAVYNGETFLRDTVSSILNQTFRDFEYIIINDGSTDNTESILASFSDPRIIVLRNEQNRGLPYSLNRGLAIAQGKYIARMDVGDLAIPHRLEKQVAFLDVHPKIGIVGSSCMFIDENGVEQKIYRVPLTDLDIRWTSLLRNPFVHPPIMLRHDVLRQHDLKYDATFLAAQDYELWTRVLQYTQGANFDEPLIYCRMSDAGSLTVEHRVMQLKNHDVVALRTIRQQLPEFAISQEQVSQLREAFIGGTRPGRERKVQCAVFASLYLDLLAAFAKKHCNHPETKKLQQRETLRIALMGSRVPLFSYWLKTLKRAVRLYPGVVYPLIRYILRKYLWKRIRRFIRRHYNELKKQRI